MASNLSISIRPEVTNMKTLSLNSVAFMCGTFYCMVAASAAWATGEADPQPVIYAAAATGYTETPAENSATAASPAAIPTDEFGHELNYCQLPWDYLPDNEEADVLPGNPSKP